MDRSHDIGVMIADSEATLELVTVRATKQRAVDIGFGDGIALFPGTTPAQATVTSTLVESNARAGIASFGSHLALGSAVLACNAMPLNGESFGALVYDFEDLGANACGCGATWTACRVLSSSLAAPTPVTQ